MYGSIVVSRGLDILAAFWYDRGMKKNPVTHRGTARIIASVSYDLSRRVRDLAQKKEIALSRVVERALLFYLQAAYEETPEKQTPAR